jgi:hypothetical protein
MEEFPLLSRCEVTIPRYNLEIRPWKNWTKEQRPEWWSKSYNKLKHDRFEHFSSANLEAVLNAVGAQFLATQLYHYTNTGEYVSVDIILRSALFSPKLAENYRGGAFWSYGDPFSYLNA